MDGQMRAPLLRRNTVLNRPTAGDSQLKSEIHTLQKKFDRLEKKEKRIQVSEVKNYIMFFFWPEGALYLKEISHERVRFLFRCSAGVRDSHYFNISTSTCWSGYLQTMERQAKWWAGFRSVHEIDSSGRFQFGKQTQKPSSLNKSREFALIFNHLSLNLFFTTRHRTNYS